MTTKPRILKEFPAPRTAGRKPTYPWDEWIDGKPRELVQGVHFECEPKSLRTLIHRTAPKYGMNAKTHISERILNKGQENEERVAIMVVVFYKKT